MRLSLFNTPSDSLIDLTHIDKPQALRGAKQEAQPQHSH